MLGVGEGLGAEVHVVAEEAADDGFDGVLGEGEAFKELLLVLPGLLGVLAGGVVGRAAELWGGGGGSERSEYVLEREKEERGKTTRWVFSSSPCKPYQYRRGRQTHSECTCSEPR